MGHNNNKRNNKKGLIKASISTLFLSECGVFR